MTVMVLVLVVFAWFRRPSGVFSQVALGVLTVAVLCAAGFDLADRTLPNWIKYSSAGVALILVVIAVVRNEDGQREKWGGILRGWFVTWPKA